MFVFAVLRQDDISLFLHQLHRLPKRRPMLEISPMSRPTEMGGIAALADVVKPEAEYASLIANQRLSSPPHGRCLSATTNSRGSISRRECGSLVGEVGVRRSPTTPYVMLESHTCIRTLKGVNCVSSCLRLPESCAKTQRLNGEQVPR